MARYVICYEAREKRETPDLMTRFREEYYDTASHRAWVKVSRAGHKGGASPKSSTAQAIEVERRSLRSKYFQKAKSAQAYVIKGQKRLIEDA